MKKFVSLTFVFLPLIATVGCSSSDEASTDETVVGTTMTTQATDTTAPTDAASAPVDNIVIDVRTPGEFAEGHLDGAVNLDLEGGVFEQQFSKLSKDGTYSIYCRSGRRSAVAVQMMKDAGYTFVIDLGGLEDAKAATGLDIVK
ncbi:MAG: rhodanese-like domain-containing protein [Ilumatobacteraceae bacterium]|jgi:phage shock protein E|nr:rhodanese-like domain-containing protein [Ilumatobacteraceae bacterium]